MYSGNPLESFELYWVLYMLLGEELRCTRISKCCPCLLKKTLLGTSTKYLTLDTSRQKNEQWYGLIQLHFVDFIYVPNNNLSYNS